MWLSRHLGTSETIVQHLAIQYDFEDNLTHHFRLISSNRKFAAHQTRSVAAHRKHPLTSSAVLIPSLAPMTWLNVLCTRSNVPPLLAVAVAPLACAAHLTSA